MTDTQTLKSGVASEAERLVLDSVDDQEAIVEPKSFDRKELVFEVYRVKARERLPEVVGRLRSILSELGWQPEFSWGRLEQWAGQNGGVDVVERRNMPPFGLGAGAAGSVAAGVAAGVWTGTPVSFS